MLVHLLVRPPDDDSRTPSRAFHPFLDEGKIARSGLFDSRYQEGRRVESQDGEKPDFEQAAFTHIEIQKLTDVESFVAVREPDGADPEKNEIVPHAEHTQKNRTIPDFFR